MKLNRNVIFTLIVLLSTLMIFNSCEKENNEEENPTNGLTTAIFNSSLTYGTMTDQDGNTYKTIKIGTQTWMAENLRTTKYRNGDLIPEVTDDATWEDLTTGALCTYENTTDKVHIATYGRFYNWYAAIDSRNIAPIGWHVPTKEEWTTLINYLGGASAAGGKMKEVGTTHWKSLSATATNESGFTALPSGSRWDPEFAYLGEFWWVLSSSSTSGDALCREIDNTEVLYDGCVSDDHGFMCGFSVRLVKD